MDERKRTIPRLLYVTPVVQRSMALTQFTMSSVMTNAPCTVFFFQWQEVQDRTDEGFLGCMHNKFDPRKGKLLVVLDGCSPYFVNEEE